MLPEAFYVYILASGHNGTLYIGHTDNLERRTAEHATHTFPHGFTARHGVTHLVYYENFATRDEAKARELKLKKYSRARKLHLIETHNPTWRNLAEDWHV